MSEKRAMAPFLALFLSACVGLDRPGEGLPASAGAALEAEQWASLGYVLYRGNPEPPAPTPAEEQQARARIASGQPWEAALLDSLYDGSAGLEALAVRDTDGDGVPDFRISDYYGRFLEGDTDLDGDGADNFLDADPYDSAQAGSPEGGIPPAVSWQALGKPAPMAEIQRTLFERHGILLVERSAAFTPALARAVFDVVTRVYAEVFADSERLSTLRLVATAESSVLSVDGEVGADDFAQVFAATQTMEVYRPGIDADPVIQLGFLAHEIGHNLQYAMDFGARERDEIVRRNYVAAPDFHALVERYGWTQVPLPFDSEAAYTLFRPQYISEQPYDYLFDGESPADWEAWLYEIYDQTGDAYLADDRVTELHVLGDYSLSNPWEWYSDHLIAYVYLSMLDSLGEQCTPMQIARITEVLQDDIVAAEWPSFRFENARGAPFQDYLRETYPISPEDARYLTETYLGTQVRGICRSALQPES